MDPGCEAVLVLFITYVAVVKINLWTRAPDAPRTRVKDKLNSNHNKYKTEGLRSHTVCYSPSHYNSTAMFQFEFRVIR